MLKKIIRHIVHFYNRIRLHNTDFTLITNTCIGGIIYHELHLQFMSPTINYGILEHDQFITFSSHLEHYLQLSLDFIPSEWNYPVAILHGNWGDVIVYFTHYKSEQEALKKWSKRKERVNPQNIFIMMDGDNCTEEQVKSFECIHVKRKVIITMKNYPECKSVFAIKRQDYVQSEILKYGLIKKSVRWFELFDYVYFFNTGKIRNNALFRNH